ncbi:MAG: hypothetical protein ACYC1E_00565 [Propionibacteriaceae bacterium]
MIRVATSGGRAGPASSHALPHLLTRSGTPELDDLLDLGARMREAQPRSTW